MTLLGTGTPNPGLDRLGPSTLVEVGGKRLLFDVVARRQCASRKPAFECGSVTDVFLTVCDQAREACPTFPGRPAVAHWGMPDPAAVVGSDEMRRQAFRDTVHYLSRRIDLLLALPVEQLERLALELRVRAIANQAPTPTDRTANLPPSPART